jgi:hypothetical protein
VRVEVVLAASALDSIVEGDGHKGSWEIGALLSREERGLDTSRMPPGQYTYHVLWEHERGTARAEGSFRLD